MSIRQLLRILLARKGLLLGTVVSTVLAATVVTLLLPSRYTATASIVVDFKAVDPVSGNVLPLALLPGYLATQLDILSSQEVALKAVDRLKLAESAAANEAFRKGTRGNGSIRHWLADGLSRDLSLDSSRESSMVRISFRGSDPKFVAAAANAIVDSYIATSLELRIEPARLTTVFFDEQLKLLKDNLDLAQKKLSAFQRRKGITATDERYDVENARLAELSSQVVAAQAQTFDTQTRRKQVDQAAASGDAADALSDVLNNPVIQSLKRQLAQSEAKLGDLSGRVGENHPQYQSARSEVEELRRKLDQEMSVVARSVSTNSSLASQREGALRRALAAQRARVLEIKKQRDEAALLMREVENAQRAYDTATSRFTQTRLQSQNTQTNIAVIDRAVAPMRPSSPRLPLNVALALVVGVVLAAGLGVITEMRDRIVRCEEDVAEACGGPVLGRLLPEPGRRAPGEAGLTPARDGPQADALRALRTQLLLRWMNAERKVLAICSPARGDGRSHLAANLAIAFSQLGSRTLLIDADLLRGQQHRIFGVPNHAGLATALVTHSATGCVQPIANFPGLWLLAAGPVPPNSLELVSRSEFPVLLHQLVEKFDVVLIDTPAAASGADAQMIAARAGAALVLAREGHTRLQELRSLVVSIVSGNAMIAGSVYNEQRSSRTLQRLASPSRSRAATQTSGSPSGAAVSAASAS